MENILQAADRLFQNRYIISIKKAFIITLPIIILGSIASLINNMPIDIVQTGLSTPAGQVIRVVNGAIWLGSTAIMAILIAWTLGYYLGNTYKLNGTLSALTSVSAYLTICVRTSDGGISLSQLGSSGLFGAILIAILATELYHAFSRLKINISEDTAEEVRQMFAVASFFSGRWWRTFRYLVTGIRHSYFLVLRYSWRKCDGQHHGQRLRRESHP